jgi:galactose-1-phosphate uridylyltransferase
MNIDRNCPFCVGEKRTLTMDEWWKRWHKNIGYRKVSFNFDDLTNTDRIDRL